MAQRTNATIGSYLVALVMLAVIPLIIIAGLLIWRQSVLQREAFERSLLQTAQALSVAVDRQLHSEQVMLETLAQSPLIDAGDSPAGPPRWRPSAGSSSGPCAPAGSWAEG